MRGENFSLETTRELHLQWNLNPIENVWAWMMKAQLRESKATSLKELQWEITELWLLKMDNIQDLKNLVESMPRRLEAIISNQRNPTKY